MGNEKNTVVTITSGTIIKTLLVLVAFYLLFVLRDLALVILTSIVIASAVEPATKWFGQYKIPRTPSVIFVYLVSLGTFFSIIYFFVPQLLDDLLQVVRMLSQYFQDTGFLNVSSGGGTVSTPATFNEIVNGWKAVSQGDLGGIVNAVSVAFGGVLSFVLVVVLSFYLAVQEKGIENFLRVVTPLKNEEYVIGLWYRSQAKIGRWMQGQLLLGLIIGVLVFLGLSILGVPNALFLAVLAALFELIPVFGPILAAVPAATLGFLDSVSLGFMVIGFYVIIQQFENHLIYPLVVRKVIGVSPILVIIAIVIGAKLAGFLGVLLSVPIASVILEFMDDIARGKQMHG